MQTTEYCFDLAIPRDELMRLYRGQAQDVLARSSCGKRIRFPATHLRRFVDERGVYGQFALTVGPSNKLVNLARQSV